ncbi:MAG TPA: HAD hydrolase family protein, partial [Desulfatirhabdiaceae bacterium]|nr:HAD hydrolase family protein [Desulfatirhabdiaceae bacterium]
MPDSFNRMFITDLDGTLLRSDGTFSHRDIRSLDALKKEGVVRVIATGRSIYSFKRAVDIHLPVDYLIFSTGVGVMDYLKESIIRTIHIESDDRDHAIRTLLEMGLNFMVHDPVPDNHHFSYHDTGKANPDFFRRIDRYREFARPMNSGESISRNPSQLLAVVDKASGDTLLNPLRLTLPTLSVIRST